MVLATGNPGKLREMQSLLAPLGYRVQAQSELGIESPPETGLSFVENALIKARHAAAGSGLPALADDSGLCVDALDGVPGIHSARYAGESADDAANNRKLLNALAGVPEARRGARYHCVIVWLRHARDPVPLICQASWEGRILETPRGSGGFGYDPLFFVPAERRSAAELEPEHKNRLSHRGRAVRLLLEQLTGRG